ncbi:hypothetical protein [Paenibacillus graminis]|uniref:hypothetical protein n=1 Tax=Paenibacillus graminis TaxID=189425 RepID=UPI000470E3B1|nr:hypothetical protein [Paenibacillus graminis]
MRTPKGYISLLAAVLSCSMLLASCDAITSQKITDTDSGSRMNGFPGRNGGMNFNGGGRGNGNGGFPEMNDGTQRNGGLPGMNEGSQRDGGLPGMNGGTQRDGGQGTGSSQGTGSGQGTDGGQGPDGGSSGTR